jgi:small subunit ribosomal protein S16
MVTIRLARFGRKKDPFYRIVALDSGKKVAGANLEVVGFWNPLKKELKIEKEKFDMWVKNGAQLSSAVKKLLEKKA